MPSNWVRKSSLPLRNWTPWWMKLKILPDRLCYVWLLSPVYRSRNFRCWVQWKTWKYWRRRRWRWMGRSICSIGWEKCFWHVWWRGVDQIVMIFCIVLYYLRWYFCEDTQQDHRWFTFNFYALIKRINCFYVKSLKFLRLTFSDSWKFMLTKSFTSINSRKFMFAKLFDMAHSRKFMFAKNENFANFSIRESFCSRKFSSSKVALLWSNGKQWERSFHKILTKSSETFYFNGLNTSVTGALDVEIWRLQPF